MDLHPKKEKRNAQLLINLVEIVTERDTSELFADLNLNNRESQMKYNLKKKQLLVVFVLTIPTTSVTQVREVL